MTTQLDEIRELLWPNGDREHEWSVSDLEQIAEIVDRGQPKAGEKRVKSQVREQTWDDFRKAGMLWWVNRILHTFQWSIVVCVEPDGEIAEAYPARTTWLGFSKEDNEASLSDFMHHLRGEE